MEIISLLTGSNDKNTAICLRGSSDHVLDEVPVPGSINDGDVELGSLELPEGDIDGDSPLTLSLQFVEDPRVLERGLAKLSSLLLELVDGPLVDTAALVDQVTSRCRLTGVDMPDHHKVDMSLLLDLLDRSSQQVKCK